MHLHRHTGTLTQTSCQLHTDALKEVNEEDEKDNASEVEDKLGPIDVVVERTEGSKN